MKPHDTVLFHLTDMKDFVHPSMHTYTHIFFLRLMEEGLEGMEGCSVHNFF